MNPTYGIVLSGGGARGFAHIGVLKALEEAGIYPSIISGVSAGAIVGTLYADGYTPDEILEIFIHLDIFKILRISRFRLGLLKSSGLEQTLKKHIRAQTFEDLKLPLSIAATNFTEAQIEYFHSGNILDPLLASCAIPLIIRPHFFNGSYYIDGGLMDNLPVGPLIGKCDKIIGVYVNPVKVNSKSFSTRNYADRIVHIGLRANSMRNIEQCCLFIEPPSLVNFNLFKVSAAKEIFNIGYYHTLSYLKEQKLI